MCFDALESIVGDTVGWYELGQQLQRQEEANAFFEFEEVPTRAKARDDGDPLSWNAAQSVGGGELRTKGAVGALGGCAVAVGISSDGSTNFSVQGEVFSEVATKAHGDKKTGSVYLGTIKEEEGEQANLCIYEEAVSDLIFGLIAEF